MSADQLVTTDPPGRGIRLNAVCSVERKRRLEMQTGLHPSSDEREIATIVRRLPPERSAQVLAFARFIAYETFKPNELQLLEDEEIFEDETTQSGMRWEAIFASEAGQTVLDKLADEALANIRAGKAKPMVFNVDGEIAPG